MSGETYAVVGTCDGVEVVMGEYRDRLDAEVVCDAWSKTNGTHEVSYRVEKDY